MKNFTQALIAFTIFFGMGMAEASEKRVFDDVGRRFRPVDYRHAEPIVFVERGIEFYVFPNGEFDFNTIKWVLTQRAAQQLQIDQEEIVSIVLLAHQMFTIIMDQVIQAFELSTIIWVE